MFRLGFLAILTTAVFLSASSFAVTNYAVGNCQPKLPSYATISQAVSAVPPGSTILVCPGNYPEQVLITQPLTLKGIKLGASDAAVVVVPAGGLTQYVPYHDGSPFDAYYQILVQNTTGPVNITNLVVDGTGGSVPAGDPGHVVGIYYQSASGSVTGASVRNQTSNGFGVGINIDGTGTAPTLTIQNSVVRGQDWEGISVIGDYFSTPFIPTIKANTVDGSPIGISLQDSGGTIQSNKIGTTLDLFAATATVSANTIAGLEIAGDSSTVTANTIAGTGNGWLIELQGGSTNLKGNKMDAGGGVAVGLISAGSAKIQSNTIVNSSTAVYGCMPENLTASGYTITGNTITDATVGVQMPSGNTTTPNTFFATASTVGACP